MRFRLLLYFFYSLNSSFIKQNGIDNLWKSSLSLINKDIKIITNGDFNYKNNYPGLEGSLEISSDNIGKFSKPYKDINILNNKLKLTSELSLGFNNNNFIYSVYNLSVNSGAFKFTGIVSGNSGKNPKIDAILFAEYQLYTEPSFCILRYIFSAILYFSPL